MGGRPVSQPISVVLVDQSPTHQRFLRAALTDEPGFTVVGAARSAPEALALVERLRPAAVLLDLDLPVRDGRPGGLDTVEQIMAGRPTPIVGYSARGDGAEALAAGAVSVVAEPAHDSAADLAAHAAELRARLRVASRVRVITHPRRRLPPRGGGSPADAQALLDAPTAPVRLVVVGASTGGPAALAAVLSALPGAFGAPVLVIQHMAEGFLHGLAGWLDDACALPVRIGRDGDRMAPGQVTVAPEAANTLVDSRLRLSCVPPPAGQLHVPGVDPSFRAAADALGPQVLAVLLTGMGRDGAAGMAELRARGARTIAQDESTSAVWGMPGAAVALGAAERVLALPDIAAAVVEAVGQRRDVPGRVL